MLILNDGDCICLSDDIPFNLLRSNQHAKLSALKTSDSVMAQLADQNTPQSHTKLVLMGKSRFLATNLRSLPPSTRLNTATPLVPETPPATRYRRSGLNYVPRIWASLVYACFTRRSVPCE
jgi:hypothetical protein